MIAVAMQRPYQEPRPVSKIRLVAYYATIGAVATLLWPWPLFEVLRKSELALRWRRNREVFWSWSPSDARNYLLACWDPTSGRHDSLVFNHAPGAPTPWRVGFAPTFRKAIIGLDKKTQGRILEALATICDCPLQPHGDTIKPLEGNLKGQWRYRIGDYRLIYHPHAEDKEILLLDFVSRGKGYE